MSTQHRFVVYNQNEPSEHSLFKYDSQIEYKIARRAAMHVTLLTDELLLVFSADDIEREIAAFEADEHDTFSLHKMIDFLGGE